MVEARICLRKLAVKIKVICEMDIIITMGGFFLWGRITVKNCDGQTVRQTRTGYREAGVTVLRPQPRTYKYLLILALDGWHSYLLISTKVSPTVRTFKSPRSPPLPLNPRSYPKSSKHRVLRASTSQALLLSGNGVRELTQGFAVQWSCIYPSL